MNNKKFIVILAAIVALGGIYYWITGRQSGGRSGAPEEAFCTMDAKLCSDGSYVGRIAPSCEFAPCPAPKQAPSKPVFEDGTLPPPQRGASTELRAEGTVSLEGDMIEEIFVIYSDKGFTPNTATINRGQTVKFVNNSSGDMWVASAPHPTHTAYSEFDAKKSVSKGETYTFTFNKVGVWKYHNHANPSDTGTISVAEDAE